MLQVPQHGYEPAAAVVMRAIQTIDENMKELKDKKMDPALAQLLAERAEAPVSDEVLWSKLAKAFDYTNSATGVCFATPIDRGWLVSATLAFACAGDYFLKADAFQNLFEGLHKPSEEQARAAKLPITFKTIDDALKDLFVFTPDQLKFAMRKAFPKKSEKPEDVVNHIAQFVANCAALSGLPQVRIERPETSDISLEAIGKPMSAEILAKWDEVLELDGHFRVDAGEFVPIQDEELEALRAMVLVNPKRAPEVALPRQFAFQDPAMFRPMPPPFQAFSENAYHQPYPYYQPPKYPFGEFQPPSTVKVTEVGAKLSPVKQFIEDEGQAAFDAMQKFYAPAMLSLCTEREFKAKARKYAAALEKGASQEERPQTRSQKRSADPKKKSRSKKRKDQSEEESRAKKQKKHEEELQEEEEEEEDS